MTKIQAYFPEDLVFQSKLVANQEGRNFSDFLRQAVLEYIQNRPGMSKKKIKLTDIKPIKISDPKLQQELANIKPEELSKKIDEWVYG